MAYLGQRTIVALHIEDDKTHKGLCLQVYLDERKVQKLMQPRILGNPTPAHGPCSVASASAMSGPPRSMERTSVSLVSADPLSNARASTGHGMLLCIHAHAHKMRVFF